MRSRSPATSRAVSAPIARLVVATCALGLTLAPNGGRPALGALPQQSDPLVVVLGYDHGPFPAGTRVPLERMAGGQVQGPDQGCAAAHYHSAPCVGPPNLVVTICDVDGQTFGPFADQAPCNCGHGVIDLFRFDVHVVSLTTQPEIVSAGGPFFIRAALRNDGPDDVIVDSLKFEVIEPNGNVLSTLVRNDIVLPAGATADPIGVNGFAETSFESLRARVSTGIFNVRGCNGAGSQAVDSNPANNSGEAQVGVIPPDFGTVPKPVEDFVAPVTNPLEELRVLPSPASGTLGTATHAPTGTLNRISVLRGDGTGGFAPTLFQVNGDSGDGGQILFDDLNADDLPDVVVPEGENLRVALGTSTGRVGPARTVPVGGVPSGGVVAGDFDGDGDVDLATGLGGNPSGRISVVTGNGRDRFSAPVLTELPGNPLAITAGDFDGDGVLDIAASLSGSPLDNPGSVAVLLGDGTGGFAQSANFGVGVRPVRVAVGDFNGDGVLDLAIANAGSDSVSIRLADGAGGLLPGVDVPVGDGPVDLAVGDFNGSASLDIAVTSEASDRLSLLLGDGAGAFFNVSIRLGAGQGSVVSLDANSDGKLDLAVGTGSADERSALRILLSDSEPVARPVIASVELMGTKTLVVTGEDFDTGATILVDGARQKTVPDASSPATRLTAKKGAKKIASGQTVVVQVESAMGVLSEWSLFTRP